MLEIELNGAAAPWPGGATLHDLVESLGSRARRWPLAVNRRVVPRERWRDTPLSARDRIDIVRAIGGG